MTIGFMPAMTSPRYLLMPVTLNVSAGYCDGDGYKLIKDLMKNYDKRIRPSSNVSRQVNVSMMLILNQIIDVDEKEQVLTTHLSVNQLWRDFTLKWDPSKYGGIRKVVIPHDLLWRPDIILYNNADVTSKETSLDTNMVVFADGQVYWASIMKTRIPCSIDVRYYPFDDQNCTMAFSSLTYNGFEVDILEVDSRTDDYISNGEWKLITINAERKVKRYPCCAEYWSELRVTISIERRWLFYMFNMMLPCFLITLVALLGFYVPPDSGEKVTMGLTTLLSMIVFLLLVADTMPASPDILPLIVIVSLATVMTVLTLNIQYKGNCGREVPGIIKKIAFGYLAKLLRISIALPDYSSSKDSPTDSLPVLVDQQRERFKFQKCNSESGSSSPQFGTQQRNTWPHGSLSSSYFEKQVLYVLQKVNQAIDKKERESRRNDRMDIIIHEWKQLAVVVYRVLFWIFMVFTIGVTSGIMLRAPNFQNFILGIKRESVED